jgi:hypothetical protein
VTNNGVVGWENWKKRQTNSIWCGSHGVFPKTI